MNIVQLSNNYVNYVLSKVTEQFQKYILEKVSQVLQMVNKQKCSIIYLFKKCKIKLLFKQTTSLYCTSSQHQNSMTVVSGEGGRKVGIEKEESLVTSSEELS